MLASTRPLTEQISSQRRRHRLSPSVAGSGESPDPGRFVGRMHEITRAGLARAGSGRSATHESRQSHLVLAAPLSVGADRQTDLLRRQSPGCLVAVSSCADVQPTAFGGILVHPLSRRALLAELLRIGVVVNEVIEE